MKILLIIILLSLYSSGIIAADWQYDLEDALKENVTETGGKSYHIDIKVVDYYLDRIAVYAKEYPPKFKSDQERKEIEFKLNQLIKLLDIIGENQQNNPEYLLRAGFANSMAHNLDITGSADKAKVLLARFIQIEPESARGNYLYGLFLAGTREYHFNSIPYLEKALKYGNEDARYTLGLLYIEKGNNKEGLKYLEDYSAANPNNESVKKVIKAVEENKLTFHKN